MLDEQPFPSMQCKCGAMREYTGIVLCSHPGQHEWECIKCGAHGYHYGVMQKHIPSNAEHKTILFKTYAEAVNYHRS